MARVALVFGGNPVCLVFLRFIESRTDILLSFDLLLR